MCLCVRICALSWTSNGSVERIMLVIRENVWRLVRRKRFERDVVMTRTIVESACDHYLWTLPSHCLHSIVMIGSGLTIYFLFFFTVLLGTPFTQHRLYYSLIELVWHITFTQWETSSMKILQNSKISAPTKLTYNQSWLQIPQWKYPLWTQAHCQGKRPNYWKLTT